MKNYSWEKLLTRQKPLWMAQDVMYWLEKHHCTLYFPWTQAYSLCCKKGNTYIMAGGSSCGGGTRERKKQLFKL